MNNITRERWLAGVKYKIKWEQAKAKNVFKWELYRVQYKKEDGGDMRVLRYQGMCRGELNN